MGLRHDENVVTENCLWYTNQFFFLYSRGKVLGQGKLINEKSGDLIDVAGYAGRGNVATSWDDGFDDLMWTMYESGEIVNFKSNLCLDVAASGGVGNVGTHACETAPDQLWSTRAFNGGFMLVNSKSQLCLDVSMYDGRGNIGTHECEYLLDQAWTWRKHGNPWKPVVRWEKAPSGCHNYPFEASVTTGVAGSKTLTREESVQIGAEITAGVEASGVSQESTLSASLSMTLSSEWQRSWNEQETITKTCPKGCLWHIKMSMRGNSFTWGTTYTFCSAQKPDCQPFKSNEANYCYKF